ncbi:MAG: hypothetical protein MJ203_01555 [archaeon]|nr:hypothetical protein [archaeon]
MTDKKCENCLYLIKTEDINNFDCIKGKHTDVEIDDYLNYSCNYWRLKE